MDELYIPETFCESCADGLTKTSYLRAILWTTDKESNLYENLPFKTPRTIMSFYSSFDYIVYELFLNLILEEKMLDLQSTFREESKTLNDDFNNSLD